jgi:hypothetical protein
MKQKLSRRVAELETISAAKAVLVSSRASAGSALEKIRTFLRLNNVQQDPKESLAETFARFLGISSPELRERLMRRGYGDHSVYLGGI